MMLHICPVRKFYQFLGEAESCAGIAAILCSSYDFPAGALEKVRLKQLWHFADTQDPRRPDAFSPETAASIAAFVRALPSDCTALYLCCDSGESRSSALAAAILRSSHKDEMAVWKNPHYHPNPLVFSTQCAALGAPVSRLGLRFRVRKNKKALAAAIKSSRK